MPSRHTAPVRRPQSRLPVTAFPTQQPQAVVSLFLAVNPPQTRLTNGEIFFGNAGTEDITITLGIHWAYSVMASTSSANRKAFAFANLIVDTLIFDAIGEQVGEDIFHVDELATANGSSGTFETFTDTATLSIDVIVLTGPVTSVGIFVDARGPPKCRRFLLRCCFIYPPSCK